ncbi:CinA family protein [Paraconexibacter algicola]|uniref:Damage-inducible protein n=1 Tax=Paraconexibacter algicola TaxID=2133960 RepID=A0A2T4UGC7_9ACTN|nr:CinA family protein [Paraconexibacter algicola]PTL58278.1 damage-inducible protein [Paraconexibacter algicola]
MLPADLTAPALRVADLLRARGQTVAVGESSSGGLICAALLSVAGASAYYRGGTVVYDRTSIEAFLVGATEMDPGRRGACEHLATFHARSAAAKVGADWGVGEAGAAGPSGNPYGDPAGHTWVAVAGPQGALRTRHLLTGEEDRERNMVAFAVAALDELAAALTGPDA